MSTVLGSESECDQGGHIPDDLTKGYSVDGSRASIWVCHTDVGGDTRGLVNRSSDDPIETEVVCLLGDHVYRGWLSTGTFTDTRVG